MGDHAIEAAFRACSGRAVATLARAYRDLDLAEEMVQDAFVVALERWPVDGVPPSPAGWIVTTARRRAIDRLRRESSRDARQRRAAALLHVPDETDDEMVLEDDVLRLIFTCCHPALTPEAQVALTLRLVMGLQTPEIARAFLVAEPTLAQRIVRAKRKIRDARIPYRIPEAEDLPERLSAVLGVLYLVFNEGYLATSGEDLVKAELTTEAIRVTELVLSLMPDEPEVRGLLALMHLTEARTAARTGPDGALVRLADQDRGRWDRDRIARGHALVRECLRRNEPGPYQIQAAIAAVHTSAGSVGETDWGQIVQLYDHLSRIAPTSVVALNRAVAVAELRGAAEGLAALDAVDLQGSHLLHATRAELLERLGRRDEAADALDRALDLVTNDVERDHLRARRDALR